MQELILHIQYLVRQHDCVIIPGIGALLAMRVPARMNLEEGIVTPQSREICFNPSITNDDGMIANSFARRDNVSFEQSKLKVERLVTDMSAALDAGETITLGGIGSLTMGDDNNIVFVPAYRSETYSSLMGEYPLTLQKVSNHTGSPTGTQHDDDKYYYFAIRKKFAHIAAACMFLFAVCAAALITLPDDLGVKKDYASVVPVENVVNTAVKKAGRVVAAEPKPQEQPTVTAEAEDNLYYIIVGTFKTQQEVDRFLEQKKNSSYKLTVLPGRKVIRVAVAASDDKNALISEMKSEKLLSEFSNPWIWKKD